MLIELQHFKVVVDAVAQKDIVNLSFGIEAVEISGFQLRLPASVEFPQPFHACGRIKHGVTAFDARLVLDIAYDRGAQVALVVCKSDKRGELGRIPGPTVRRRCFSPLSVGAPRRQRGQR